MAWSLKLMQFFLKPAGCSSRGHDAEWNGRCWETLPGALSLCTPRFLVGFRWGKKKAHNLHLSPTFELTWNWQVIAGCRSAVRGASNPYAWFHPTPFTSDWSFTSKWISCHSCAPWYFGSMSVDPLHWWWPSYCTLHIHHILMNAQFLRCRNQQQWEQRHGQVLSVHSTLAFRYQKSIFVYKKKSLTSL